MREGEIISLINELSNLHIEDLEAIIASMPQADPYITRGGSQKSAATDVVKWAQKENRIPELIYALEQVMSKPVSPDKKNSKKRNDQSQSLKLRKPSLRERTTITAAWFFGSFLIIFLIGVFIWGPDILPAYKLRLIPFFCALVAGLFAIFFGGYIRLNSTPILAGGGVALFLVVLWFWPTNPKDINPPPATPSGQAPNRVEPDNPVLFTCKAEIEPMSSAKTTLILDKTLYFTDKSGKPLSNVTLTKGADQFKVKSDGRIEPISLQPEEVLFITWEDCSVEIKVPAEVLVQTNIIHIKLRRQ
jgi:hypothetical protein